MIVIDVFLLFSCYYAILFDDKQLLVDTIMSKSVHISKQDIMDLFIKSLIEANVHCLKVLVDQFASYTQDMTWKLALVVCRECDDKSIGQVEELIHVNHMTPKPRYTTPATSARQTRSVEELRQQLVELSRTENMDTTASQIKQTGSEVTGVDISLHRQTLWFIAAEEGNVEWLKELAAQGVDINCHNIDNMTALQIVAADNQLDCVRFLSHHQMFIPHVHVKPSNRGGCCTKRHIGRQDSPLCMASTSLNIEGMEEECSRNRLECIKLLRDCSMKYLTEQDLIKEVHKALVGICTSSGDLKVVEYLLVNGADVNYFSHKLERSLCYTQTILCQVLHSNCFNKYDIAKMLLNAGCDVDGIEDCIPLHFCQTQEDMKLLLDRGANINKENSYGETPLIMVISQNSSYRLVNMLLKRGNVLIEDDVTESLSNLRESDSTGSQIKVTGSPCKLTGSDDTGSEVTGSDAVIDVNHQDDWGWSALLKAVANGAVNSTRLLLKCGANVNIHNSSQYIGCDPAEIHTPLLYAIYNGFTIAHEPILTIAKELIKHKSILIDKKCQPLATVIKHNQFRIAKILLQCVGSQQDLQRLQASLPKDTNQEIMAYISTTLTAPFSLRHLVRDTIRCRITYISLINQLLIPTHMKHYLTLSELDLFV